VFKRQTDASNTPVDLEGVEEEIVEVELGEEARPEIEPIVIPAKVKTRWSV
jgi:hypothetical protein